MAIEKIAPAEAEAEKEPPQVRVLTLELGEHRDSTIYRFHKGYRLQFCPAPGLLGRRVTLYTNYGPGEQGAAGAAGVEPPPFERARYYALAWRRLRPDESGAPEPEPGDEPRAPPAPGDLLAELDLCCELALRRAGVYHYYFVCEPAEAGAGPHGSGWFHVTPTLACGPLDGVACQTVVAKCLGPLPRWEAALRVSHEAGYNMVHLTPVQRLGASGSAYSIADQLRLDPRYGPGALGDVRALAERLRARWGLASICDVVLNHTADETPWLAAHPDAAYNCAACPHLRPAALLDAALARLSAAAARGELAARGVPPAVTAPAHIEAVERILTAEVVPELRLHEMFTCDVDDVVRQYRELARSRVPGRGGAEEGELRLAPDPLRRRLRATVDLELALRLYHAHGAAGAGEAGEAGEARLARRLRDLNAAAERELRDHLRAAVANCVAGMRYCRLQADGPKVAEVSEKHPLVPRYFSWAECPGSAAAAEALVYSEAGRRVMAHNGWVVDADPLQDFAAAAQAGRVYLRRELLAWGDSVKLRYGDRPEDSPFLWAHMREYVELTAGTFDGLRLDNCHSTPLHVAEYMLDCARRVNPELYVVAELFTNSDLVDNIFVNRLGITSLIREAQSAWDAREQGRLVHRFGGRAVGSLRRGARRGASPRVAHALLLDLTHDNPSPLERRCVFDALPCAALVAVACAAAGSTRGLDELVPHQVHVVDEARLYREWGDVGPDAGMLAARRALNELHRELAADGYSEVYVDQMDDDVVAVTRHNPRTRQSVILVAYTAFRAPEPAFPGRAVQPLRFEGVVDEVLLEASLRHRDHESTGRLFQPPTQFAKHPEYINGLTEYAVSVRRHLPLGEARSFAGARREGALTVLEWRAPAPGDVVALRVSPAAPAATALRLLAAPPGPPRDPLALEEPLRRLALGELALLLYSSEPEERAATGGGAYDVPGRGPLVYAGLQGVASMLDEMGDDLGHPLGANLRAGDWLPEHQWRRLEACGGDALGELAHRLRDACRPLGALPRYLVPAHFAALARRAHAAAEREALRRLGPAAAGRAAGRRAAARLPARRAAAAARRAVRGPAALRGGPHALLGARHVHLAARPAAADRPLPGGARAHPGLRGVPAPRADPQPAGRRAQRALQLPRRRLVVAAQHQAVLHRGAGGLGAAAGARVAVVPHRRRRARAARRRRPAAARRGAGGAADALPGPRVPRAQRGPADRRAHAARGVRGADRHRPRDRVPVRRQRLELRHVDGQDGLVGARRHARPARHAARRQRRGAGRAGALRRRLAAGRARRAPLPARGPAPRGHHLELGAVGRAHRGALRALLLGAARALRRRRAPRPRAPPRHLQGHARRLAALGRLPAALQLRRRHGARARAVRAAPRLARARRRRAAAARPARREDARPGRLGLPRRLRQLGRLGRPERRARLQLPPGARVGVAARLLRARAARLRARQRPPRKHRRRRARRARPAARRAARLALARPARADQRRRRLLPRLVPHAGLERRQRARGAARHRARPLRAPAARRLTGVPRPPPPPPPPPAPPPPVPRPRARPRRIQRPLLPFWCAAVRAASGRPQPRGDAPAPRPLRPAARGGREPRAARRPAAAGARPRPRAAPRARRPPRGPRRVRAGAGAALPLARVPPAGRVPAPRAPAAPPAGDRRRAGRALGAGGGGGGGGSGRGGARGAGRDGRRGVGEGAAAGAGGQRRGLRAGAARVLLPEPGVRRVPD